DDAVGAGAPLGGYGGGWAGALPDQAGVVVEAVAARHVAGDGLEVGGSAVRVVVVVDAEAAAQEAEAGAWQSVARGLGDPGLEPAHRPGALSGKDDPLAPGEGEDLTQRMRLPDREQVEQAAATDVDQVLPEDVVAQLHRPAAETEEREVG